MSIDETLAFWFGPLSADGLAENGRFELWFNKDDEVDAEIRRRFGSQLASAMAGELNHWRETPDGLLALVITLDQFSRNLFRNTPRAFAGDPLALTLALEAIGRGQDRSLPTVQRAFLYMPLEHSEELSVQDQCISCFESLVMDATPAARPLAKTFLGFAHKHRDVILRFNRYPHRNGVLGRQSTPEELEFLSQPGSSF